LKDIFAYWTGGKPVLIEILHELMSLHSRNGTNYTLNLLSGNDFVNNYKDLPKCFDLLCPAHQADVVRVWTLLEHGGIWLDSDSLVLNSLSSLFDICETKNGFFMTQNREVIFNGVFGSNKNTLLMNKWKEHILRTLDQHGENIHWTQIGNQFLTESYIKNKSLFDEYVVFDGPGTMYPVNWDQCVNSYLEKPYWTYRHLTRDFQPLIVLVNSVYKALGSHSKAQLLDSEYPLNYFINASLRSLLN
jgi:hypothetical protein